MRALVLVLLATALASFALANGAPQITTVILVRHAEKIADTMHGDVPLSEAGQLRARELARVLGGAGITAIYTTPYARTRQTAAPVAEALKLQPVEVKSGATYAAEMAAIVRERHAGGTVLVVGHSNTTQQVIRALGIADPPPIADPQYDDLFIVTMAAGSEPRLLSLRYGAVAR